MSHRRHPIACADVGISKFGCFCTRVACSFFFFFVTIIASSSVCHMCRINYYYCSTAIYYYRLVFSERMP